MRKSALVLVSAAVVLSIGWGAFARSTTTVAFDFAQIRPGMVVCEVGAGTGRFALPLAERVGPSGKVYANDIVETGKLDVLRERAKAGGLQNIETILGTETDPRLPRNTMDVVFIVDAFHDFGKKVEMLKSIAPSLKPGGRLVILDAEMDKEEPWTPNRSRLLSRAHFLSFVQQSPFEVERIDDSSFPKDGPERPVLYALTLKRR